MQHRLHRNPLAVAVAIAIVSTLAPPSAGAGESPFGYVYTTDTHPKGEAEIEQWATFSKGKMQGDYKLGQYRTELEYGVTDRFQVSLYLNTYSVNASRDNSAGETGGPYIPEKSNKENRYRRGLSVDGWSAEFIYRLLSPYKDPLGLARLRRTIVRKVRQRT